MGNSPARKRIVVLGATGSIGESALKVARDIPERMEIVGVAANSNAEKLAAAANETRAPFLCLVDETKMDILRRAIIMCTFCRWTPSTMPSFNALKVGGALVPRKIAALRPLPHFNPLTFVELSSPPPAGRFAKHHETGSIPSHRNRH